MIHLIKSDIKNNRCRVFDDETLKYVFMNNKDICEYIFDGKDVGNFSFNEQLRNRHEYTTFMDDIDKCKAVCTVNHSVSSFGHRTDNVYCNKIFINKKYECMFTVDLKDVLLLQFGDYFYKIDINKPFSINGIDIGSDRYAYFLHGVGIDKHSRILLDVRVSDYSKGYNTSISSLYLYKDGSVSSRKFNLKKLKLGIEKQFKTSQRNFLLKG